jgi:hypothetical protein
MADYLLQTFQDNKKYLIFQYKDKAYVALIEETTENTNISVFEKRVEEFGNKSPEDTAPLIYNTLINKKDNKSITTCWCHTDYIDNENFKSLFNAVTQTINSIQEALNKPTGTLKIEDLNGNTKDLTILSAINMGPPKDAKNALIKLAPSPLDPKAIEYAYISQCSMAARYIATAGNTIGKTDTTVTIEICSGLVNYGYLYNELNKSILISNYIKFGKEYKKILNDLINNVVKCNNTEEATNVIYRARESFLNTFNKGKEEMPDNTNKTSTLTKFFGKPTHEAINGAWQNGAESVVDTIREPMCAALAAQLGIGNSKILKQRFLNFMKTEVGYALLSYGAALALPAMSYMLPDNIQPYTARMAEELRTLGYKMAMKPVFNLITGPVCEALTKALQNALPAIRVKLDEQAKTEDEEQINTEQSSTSKSSSASL